MRKKIVLLIMLVMSVISFGKINDSLDIFTPDEEKVLEERIVEVAKKRDIDIYLNTFLEEEGFVPEKTERLILINMIRRDEKNVKVELKLTKDMDLTEVRENIDAILIANEKHLAEKDYVGYVEGIVEGLDGILENVKIEKPIVTQKEVKEEKEFSFYVGIGLVFFIIFAIIIRILMVKYKKSFKEEMDIISGDE